MVSGWQPQGCPAGVVDDSGGHAEQLVAQPGGVCAAAVVEAGEGLEEDGKVPGQ